jgi:hypothetical protein
MQPAARKKRHACIIFKCNVITLRYALHLTVCAQQVTDPDSGGVRSTAEVRYRSGQGQPGAMTQGIPRSAMQPIQ